MQYVLLSLLITSITLWIQRMQTKQTKGIRNMFFCDSMQQCHYMRFTHSMRTPSTSSNISLKVTSSRESNMDIAETTEIKCQTLARAGKQNHPSSIISGIVVCNFVYIIYCMF